MKNKTNVDVSVTIILPYVRLKPKSFPESILLSISKFQHNYLKYFQEMCVKSEAYMSRI